MNVKRSTFFAVAFLILFLLVTAPLISHRAIENYTDPHGPLYVGSYADDVGNFDGSLRVVNWNLHYGEKLDQIIETLAHVPELREADILTFQEIDAVGVETIAQRLHYNYVFYPAILDHHKRIAYGDAILSKWPLSNPTKIVLPIFIPGWLESRHSAGATMTIGGREIMVYSTHLDLTWMILMRGESQAEFLSKAAGKTDDFIILGGDFNTWFPPSIAALDKHMGEVGLERLTEGTGHTFEWAGLRFILDHIYSKAVLENRAGVYRQTDASDHYPEWSEMLLEIR